MWSNGGYTTSAAYGPTIQSVQPIAIVPQGPVQPQFPEYYHKYMCCCGGSHVKTGTKVLGILDALFLVLSIGRLIMAFIHINDGQRTETWSIVFMSIMFGWLLLAVIGIFLALRLEKAYWLIPKLAHQALVILCTIAIIIISILYLTKTLSGQYRTKYEETFFPNITVKAWIMIGVSLVFLSVELWMFTVVKRCFTYLSDKTQWKESHQQPQVTYGGQPAQMPFAYQPQAPMMAYGEDQMKM